MGLKPLEELAADASRAIVEHGMASLELIEVTKGLKRLQSERATRKTEAVLRLCAERPTFSMSRADSLAQLDPAYAEYKKAVALAEVAVLASTLNVEGALLAVELQIALVRASGGAAS